MIGGILSSNQNGPWAPSRSACPGGLCGLGLLGQTPGRGASSLTRAGHRRILLASGEKGRLPENNNKQLTIIHNSKLYKLQQLNIITNIRHCCAQGSGGRRRPTPDTTRTACRTRQLCRLSRRRRGLLGLRRRAPRESSRRSKSARSPELPGVLRRA